MIILIANAHPYLSGLANLSCPQADKGAKQDLLPHHTVIRKHRTARTLARIKTTQKTVGYLLQPRPDQMSSTCSDPAYPINAPAFIRHRSLRPASRDLSGDARSGNANRTVPPPRQASIVSRSFPTGLPISSGPSFHPRPARLAMDLKRVRARTRPINGHTWKPPDNIFSLRCIRTGTGPRHMQCVYFSKG